MSEPLVGRFILAELLGAGAMGEVYAAHDIREARRVAVKRLRPGANRDPALVERFAREGAILRAAAHPNIVSVLALVDDVAGPAIVMEYVAGGGLDATLAREPRLPIDRVLSIALDLSDALARAHRLGIIHRDLKPANVLIADDGTPRLTDFGIAHLGGGPALTGSNMVLGTLPYLSPEAWDGDGADARGDIWAFGVMLYEMLAGRRPFQGVFPGLLHAAIATAEPAPLAALRDDVPPALAAAVAGMLVKDPMHRMASVRELGVVVERLLRVGPNARADVTAVGATEGRDRLAATPARGALPHPASALIGRERETSDVLALVTGGARLVTLSGPGGTGKTRLALDIAARAGAHFADGVTYVDLTPLADAALVLPTLAQALGVEEDLTRPLVDLLVERLRPERRLLVLDNFEQVLGAAPDVARLLQAAPGVAALITSRFVLRVAGEREYVVPPLDVPGDAAAPADVLAASAGTLFVERARAAMPGFALTTTNAGAVAAICRRLDGLPLAIELAAARARVLPPGRLLAGLARPLELLTGGGADRAPHQRTLRATIAWSYDLLEERDRVLFRRLGAFVGGWSLADAELVVGAPNESWDLPALVDGLQSLAEKSLIVVQPAEGEPRYGMLETLRQFARERLAESSEAEALAERHARHFGALAERRNDDVPTVEQADALAWFAHAHDNLRASLAWADARDPALLLSTVAALGRFWYFAGHWHEALGWCRRALVRAEHESAAARALVLDHMGRLEMFLGDEPAALDHHEQARVLAATVPDERLQARTAEGLGEVLLKVGQTDRALAVLHDAVSIARRASEMGHVGELPAALTTLATGEVTTAPDSAETRLQEALSLARTQGDRFILTKVYYYLAGIALLRDDADTARALCDEGRRAALDSGDESWAHHLDEMLARALARDGDVASAGGLAAHSLRAFHAVGSRSCLPHAFEAAARLELARGQDAEAHAAAARLIGAADAICTALSIAMLPVERALLAQTRAATQSALGDAYGPAYDEGRRWTEAEAVAQAGRSSGSNEPAGSVR